MIPTPMTFRRFGRSHHLVIETAADLERIHDLTRPLWVATGAPIDTIACDRTFLELVDTDHNGRILAYEMREAVRWLFDRLSCRRGIDQHSDVLHLEDIDANEEEGLRIRRSVRKMLTTLGTPDAERITIEQVRSIKAQVEANPVSEAGVVIPQAATDDDTSRFLEDIVASLGGIAHPSGRSGVNSAMLDDFLAQSRAYLDWLARGEIPRGNGATDIMPLGDRTPAAYAKLDALRAKVDQYFAQCEAAALDPSLADRSAPRVQALDATDFGDPAAIRILMESAPLAPPTPERALAFDNRVNPFYVDPIEALRREAIEPALGRSVKSISERDWESVKAFFEEHRRWLAAKPAEALEPLGAPKLREYLDDRYAYAVKSLIAAAAETAFVLDNIRLTEKLILYQAKMIDLANNFVSFPHLYDPSKRAMFEMGSLIMDGRRFNMAVKVTNRAEHAKVAASSDMYVLYVEVHPRDGRPRYEVAVPVTHHGRGNLVVGKRGLFAECDHTEHDAQVLQIIENPISLSEAVYAPFKRLGRLITGKIEALTADAEKALDTTVTQGVPAAGAPAAQPTPQPAKGGSAGNLILGGGVAIAALGSSFAYIAKSFGGENWWKLPLAVGIAILAIMLPTVILAFVKLRRRDLSAILEGSGWGINARMRLSRRQARFFSQRPPYPPGSRGVRRWKKWIVLLIVLILAAGSLGTWKGCRMWQQSKLETQNSRVSE